MKLTDLRGIIVDLDRAYEVIESEYRKNGGLRAEDRAGHFYHEGPRRRDTGTFSPLRPAGQQGARRGFDNDTLANALTQEMTAWLWLSRYSDTAASMLQIDRWAAVDRAGSDADRFGAMVSYSGWNDYDVRLAASRDSVVPTKLGSGLWAPRADPEMSLRRGPARQEPWSFAFDREGQSRELTFSSVRDGYEQYLRATGKPISKEALSRLGDCPPPRLIGALASGARTGEVERVPMGFAETWMSTDRARAADRMWSDPCEACEVGLAAWTDGHDELVASLPADARGNYQKVTEDWVDFLRNEGSETRRRLKSPQEKARSAASAAVAGAAMGAPRPEAAAGATGAHQPKAAVSGTAGEPAVAASARESGLPAAVAVATGIGAATAGAERLAAIGAAVAASGAAAPVTYVQSAAQQVASAKGTIAEAEDELRPEPVRFRPMERGGGRGRDIPEPQAPPRRQGQRQRVHVRLESSEFPCDDIEIRELVGKEAISRLFSFHVDIVCPVELDLSVEQVLGAPVSLVFEEGRDEVRRLHGTVAQIDDRLETESTWRSYRLWIVPRMWRSTLVETQEVFLDTKVPDLIQQKLSLVDVDVEMRLRSDYPLRELIVQYKETDVAFVSRLAEHLGICFFFEHGDADKIVFTDDSTGFRPLKDCGVIPFSPRGEKVDVFEIEARSRAFPSSYAMQDYNYRTPTVDLTSMAEAQEGFAGGVVEYGAHYRTPAEGAAMAKLRAEERRVENRYYVGKSDVSQLEPGGTFKLSGHARLEGTEFLVVEVEHHARQTVKMKGAAGADDAYRNTFRVIDARVPYRPPRTTPRPRIHGLLTAIVEAPGNIAESAVLDGEGRYTIKFYFDAADVSGRSKHSRLVRMIQPHSGPSYGIHFPLKPGIEVLVAFMDGDPDRPLIVGSVPNPITPSPVMQEVNLMNRIETTSGLIIEMRDAVPPLAR